MKFKNLVSAVSALAVAGSVFAGLAVTGYAVGEVIYSNDFETSSDFVSGGNSKNVTIKNPDSGTNGSKIIGTGTADGDSNLTSPSLTELETYDHEAEALEVSFDFKMDGCVGGKSSNIALLGAASKSSWLDSDQQIFTISASANGNGYWNTITVNGKDYTSQLKETGTYDFGGLNRDTTGWVNANVIINFPKSTVTYTLKKGEQVIAEDEIATFVNSGVKVLDRVFMAAGKTYGGVAIDNLVIKTAEVTEVPDPAGSVTVKYVDSSNDSTVFDTKTVDTSSMFAGDPVTYSYPAYLVHDGAYYKAETTANYGETFILTKDPVTKTVKYTKVEDDVIAFIEGETTTPEKNDATGYETATEENIRYSSGKAVTTQGTGSYYVATVTVSADGKYTFAGPLYNSNNKSRTVDIYIDGKPGSGSPVASVPVNSNQSSSFSFEVPLKTGEHTFVFAANYSLTPAFDYVVVTKTGELPAEPELPEDVTVTSGGENVNDGHEDEASIWQALVSGTGKSYSKVTADVTLKNGGGSQSATVDTGTVVTDGDVNIIVVVNKLVEDIEKIVISVE